LLVLPSLWFLQRHDIWGDEDEAASATSNAKPSQQTQTIRKWLSKQKEKN
jgi:hypothetical protein